MGSRNPAFGLEDRCSAIELLAHIFAGFPPAHRLSYARMPFQTAQRSCGRKEADERREKVELPVGFDPTACGLQIRRSAN